MFVLNIIPKFAVLENLGIIILLVIDMPKMKVNGSTKKRFKLTGSGKVKRKKAFGSHILTKKTQKRKRNLRKGTLVHTNDEARVKKMLGK